MKKLLLISLIPVSLTSCSQFMLLASTGSIALSNNIYAKAYSGVDILTIMNTEKSMKQHIYERIKEPKRQD